MGTRTEFDLDRHITNWRKQFLADSTFYSEEVEELENHVRDGVEHLMETGFSKEEAFYEATARLGSPDALRADYQRARPLAERSFTLARAVALCTFLIPMLIVPMTGGLSNIIHSLGGHAATLVLYLGAVLMIIWTGHRSALTSAGEFGLRTGSVLILAGMAVVMLLVNLLSPFTVLLYSPLAPFLAIALSWISKGHVPVGVAPALVFVLLLFSVLFGWASLAMGPLMLSLLITYAVMDATLGWIVERALADRHQATTTLQPA